MFSSLRFVDILTQMGPFVDCEHHKVKDECDTTQTFEMQFMKVYRELKNFAERCPHTHLVIVPSLRDVHHNVVFPQPPFTLPLPASDIPPNLHFVPNPAYFIFNGILFGACNLDVLKHLAAEEVYITSDNAKSDRFVHLTQHLIQQQRCDVTSTNFNFSLFHRSLLLHMNNTYNNDFC